MTWLATVLLLTAVESARGGALLADHPEGNGYLKSKARQIRAARVRGGGWP